MEEDEREIDNDEDIYNERSNLNDMKQENHTDDHTNNKNKHILNDNNQKESHRKEKVGFTRLPLTKIKNIMKLDGDVGKLKIINLLIIRMDHQKKQIA